MARRKKKPQPVPSSQTSDVQAALWHLGTPKELSLVHKPGQAKPDAQIIWLAPDTGQPPSESAHCLVGLCVNASAAGEPDTPEAYGSVPQPGNIWQAAQQLHALTDLRPGPVAGAGMFLAAARLQFSPQLVQGQAAASPALLSMLGRPAEGTALLLYANDQPCTQPQQAGAVPQAPSQAQQPESADSTYPAQAEAVWMRMQQAGAEGLPAVLPPAAPAGASGAKGLWALQAVKRGGAKMEAVLAQLLQKHLSGRTIMQGSLLAAPVLGHDCVFSVEQLQVQPGIAAPGGAATASSAGSPSSSAGTGHLQAGMCQATTLVHLLQQGQQPPRLPDSSSAGPHSDGFAPAQPADSSKLDIVARARAAAAGAAGEREEAGPAAEAAGRAAAAGLAAAHEGFAVLGGVQHHVRALYELVSLPLKAPQLFAHYNIRPPRGVLLWGPPGCGKTCLARAAAAEAGCPLFVLNGPDVVSEFYGESEAGLQGVFAAARALAPSVVCIDELDALAPARGGSAEGGASAHHAAEPAEDMSARVVTTLLTEMDGLSPGVTGAEHQVVVIAATNRPEAVDSALRRPGRFDRELEIGVPSPAGRTEILRTKLRRLKHSLSDEQVASLAAAAHGFVGADLAALCNEAAMAALRRIIAEPDAERRVTPADFGVAQTRVRPSAMREVAIEVPRVTWADVGGLDDVKLRLQEAVQWPHLHPEALERLGALPPQGVLLYGPPGCSKTLLARAVANEAKLNFLAVKGPELYSKFVGQAEKAVAALFARARGAAPAVIFFDEIDGLVGSREEGGAGGEGAGHRVLSQLLMEMDGLQARVGVTVLAATNRPDCVDPALVRPGRFDRLLHVPPPDEAGRRAVLAVHTRRMPLAADVDLQGLAAQTQGCTGADLAAIAREAALAALTESLDATVVGHRHFAAAMQVVKPSVQPASQQQMYRKFSRS